MLNNKRLKNFNNLSPPYYFKENDKKIPAHFQKFSNAMEGSYSEK